MLQKHERFGKCFMVLGSMTGRVVLLLIKVTPNVKINSQYYVNKVFKPLLEKEVPKSNGKDIIKVYVHHNAASSHKATFTRDYSESLK